MANKWAIASGNWNATATWNDNSIPVNGDVVYTNGYTVTLNVDPNQPQTILTNGLCEDTQGSGGSFILQPAVAILTVKELKQVGINTLLNLNISGNSNAYYFHCAISNESGYAMSIRTQQTNRYYFYGDINIGNYPLINSHNNYSYPLAIVQIDGNVYSEYAQPLFDTNTSGGNGAIASFILNGTMRNALIGKTGTTTTINGSIELPLTSDISCTTLNLNGILTAKNNRRYTGTTINVNGKIEYQSNNNTTGVHFTTMNILNPDEFRWVDISEPRINPFIIITDWDFANEVQYPPENRVVAGIPYAFDEKVGTFEVDYPPESVVLNGYEYDNGNMTGSMSAQAQVGCVTKEDVREGVPLIGMGEFGTLVVPSVDDVREGVVFDNGSVGTLIVQGGGDRLRIADFGYYTNAQSDTYIVDLTEQDKPKFAVAEERVLIEMFPDLDLDNIPDKYFDDLFVKYLKYRLIVEYYRTAGINSTFTPSEPTTEIVNYQNVRNEVWLNSANIYLKAWAKKYPESIMKPQRILL